MRSEVGNESFLKKLQKKLARLKIRCTFAPASRNTKSETRGRKQEWHVHRHIELTAVLSQDKTNKKE